MSDPVATLALCKWLRDRVKEWETEAKAALSMTAGERAAANISGKHLGFVTLARGKRQTHVDETRLLEWVKTHHPTEIEESVRPAFRKKLMDQAVSLGGIVDPDGVVDEDAVRVTQGDPYPMTQLDAEADIAIAALLAKGRIGVNGLRALDVAPEPADRWTTDTEAGAIG